MRNVRIAFASFAFLGTAALLATACGGDDSSGTGGGDDAGADQLVPDSSGGDVFVPDAALDAAPDSAPDTSTGDASDGGGDADADAGPSCTLGVTSIAPTQGWTGVDVPVTITGSGFQPCGVDGGADAGACADRFKLVLTACLPQAADAGAPDGGPACPDAGATEWPISSLIVASSTQATGVVAAGGPPGAYTVVDTQGACTAKSATYTILPATVSISKVVPPFAWTGADTPVTIAGSNFESTPRAFLTIPSASPTTQKLKDTAFVSSGSLNAVVPAGLAVGGPYALTVVNPDYTGGTLAAAVRVTANPPPTITTVAPASLTTSQLGVANNITITGCNIRAGATVSTVDAAGTVTAQTAGALSCNGAQTCANNTKVCTFNATVNAGLAAGPYLVRVTDTDESTYGDYSMLVVTNPAAKLSTGFTTSANALNAARRSLASTSGRINDASRFLYAVGGENATGTVLDSIEVAPLDLFGTVGKWTVQRNHLATARAGASVVTHGKYMYVIGGTPTANGTGGATPVGALTAGASIERAKILDLTELPTLADPTVGASGTLAAGSWYYRVALVHNSSDVDNPNGEALPSDEVVATLSTKGSVALSWTAPAGITNIAKYRIYRTAAVNGASGSEVLIGETASAAVTTFTDDGSATPGTQTPLVRGSTGVFVASTVALKRPRFNANAVIAPDPNGALFVYVTGGHGQCAAMSAVGTMNCYEYAPLSADGATLGAFTEDTTHLFTTPRERHGVAEMDASNGYTGWPGSSPSFVFLSGGLAATQPSQNLEYAAIASGGALGTWNAGARQFATKRDGSQLQVANGYLYAFLGGTPGNYTSSIDLTNATDVTTTPITLTSWSNATAAPPVALGRMGVTLESAYFYVIGGTTNDTDAQSAIYQVVY